MTIAAKPWQATDGGYAVRAPRETDAVGMALRRAFAAPDLSGDITRMLGRLDRRG